MIGISFWGDENALEFNSGDGCTTLNILKTTEFYTLKGWLLLCELYLNLKRKIIKEKID